MRDRNDKWYAAVLLLGAIIGHRAVGRTHGLGTGQEAEHSRHHYLAKKLADRYVELKSGQAAA